MIPFEYDGKTYYYKEIIHRGEYSNWITTKIFDSPIMQRRKYLFFGDWITVENTRHIGELLYSITSTAKTKEENRKNLARILGHEGREEEIRNGEIV